MASLVLPCCVVFLPQESYNKLNIVSQAEFDSMRASGEQEEEGGLMFGPLDQEDPSTIPTATVKKTSEFVTMATSRREDMVTDGAGGRTGRGSPSPIITRHQQPQKRQHEERIERFYPVFNKHESPSTVRPQCVVGVRVGGTQYKHCCIHTTCDISNVLQPWIILASFKNTIAIGYEEVNQIITNHRVFFFFFFFFFFSKFTFLVFCNVVELPLNLYCVYIWRILVKAMREVDEEQEN